MLGSLRTHVCDHQAPSHAQMHNPLRRFLSTAFGHPATSLCTRATLILQLNDNMLAYAMHPAYLRAFERLGNFRRGRFQRLGLAANPYRVNDIAGYMLI